MDVDPPSELASSDAVQESSSLFNGTPHRLSTRRRAPSRTIYEKVGLLCRSADRIGITLPVFFHALFYGDAACSADGSMAQRRRRFAESPLLPAILRNMWRPRHRGGKHHGKRLVGAKRTIRSFAFATVKECLEQEVLAYEAALPTTSQPVTGPALLDTSIDEILATFMASAPQLMKLLGSLVCGKNSDRRIGENHELHNRNMLSVIGSMIVFARSNRQNKLQRKLSIYFKAKGTPKKVFDFLQSIGLVLSYSWTLDAEKRLAMAAKADMRDWVAHEACLIDIDNVLLRFAVSSQRMFNKTETINATAGTIVKLPRRVLAALRSYGLSVTSLRVRMATARRDNLAAMPRIQFSDLLQPAARQRLARLQVHQIAMVLLDLNGLRNYPHRSSAALQSPPPVRQLPTGPEHKTEYFMLETEPIDENSYEGMQQVITAFMRQMGLDDAESQRLLGTERGLPFGGDGLTTARIRALQRFRVDADNGFDRLDFLFTFGCLFHQQWWIGIDIHHNHYGSLSGNGLGREIHFLGRTGLAASNKKPDFHTLDEMIRHFWTASTLDCWLEYSGCGTLGDLEVWAMQQSATRLASLAEKIWKERQSTNALVDQQQRRSAQPTQYDDVLYNRTMANRDCLFYLMLRRSIQQGDIGVYIDALPDMLAFYKGGNNVNYARETVEMLQFLHKEAPPNVRDLVIDNCLLVNLTGKPGKFMPTGQLQEQNNDKIKNNFSTHAPGSSMKLTKELSPALPVLDAICKHVDSSFTLLYHGTSHTTPNADADVARMVERFHHLGTSKFTAGRDVESAADRPKDQFKAGTRELASGSFFSEWWDAREVFHRYSSTAQEYGTAPA